MVFTQVYRVSFFVIFSSLFSFDIIGRKKYTFKISHKQIYKEPMMHVHCNTYTIHAGTSRDHANKCKLMFTTLYVGTNLPTTSLPGGEGQKGRDPLLSLSVTCTQIRN